jgi:hypothetical protein
MAIRTFPVRVDLEQAGGRTRIHIFPETVTIRVGDGLEWDFRYLGGADAIVEEIVIEFEKPAPFSKSSFRIKNPGSARPQRQLSGAAVASAASQAFRYTIRCLNLVKTEIASAQPALIITET